MVDLENGAAGGLTCHQIRLGGPINEDANVLARLGSCVYSSSSSRDQRGVRKLY